MANLTLVLSDLSKLNNAHSKLLHRKKLTNTERDALLFFLTGLPSADELIKQQFDLNEKLIVEVHSMDQSWPHIEKWIDLFNSLPKETSFTGVHAMAIDAQCDDELWKRNVIIDVSFIPTLSHLRRKDTKSIYLSLKIDGTAFFRFNLIKDAEKFPELYKFQGTWTEAYLLVVKTLQQGWPQTEFPEEFEQLLKK